MAITPYGMIVEVEQVIWQSVNHLITPSRRHLPPSRKHIQHATHNGEYYISLQDLIMSFYQAANLCSRYSGVSQYEPRTLIGRPMVIFQ